MSYNYITIIFSTDCSLGILLISLMKMHSWVYHILNICTYLSFFSLQRLSV